MDLNLAFIIKSDPFLNKEAVNGSFVNSHDFNKFLWENATCHGGYAPAVPPSRKLGKSSKKAVAANKSPPARSAMATGACPELITS